METGRGSRSGANPRTGTACASRISTQEHLLKISSLHSKDKRRKPTGTRSNPAPAKSPWSLSAKENPH